MDKFVIISIVVTALCAALVLFRIEARQKRTSMLKPGSYKFGLLGMVVYLVMYGVLTVIEKMCFMMGKAPRLNPHDDVYFNPAFRNSNTMNVFHREE